MSPRRRPWPSATSVQPPHGTKRSRVRGSASPDRGRGDHQRTVARRLHAAGPDCCTRVRLTLASCPGAADILSAVFSAPRWSQAAIAVAHPSLTAAIRSGPSRQRYATLPGHWIAARSRNGFDVAEHLVVLTGRGNSAHRPRIRRPATALGLDLRPSAPDWPPPAPISTSCPTCAPPCPTWSGPSRRWLVSPSSTGRACRATGRRPGPAHGMPHLRTVPAPDRRPDPGGATAPPVALAGRGPRGLPGRANRTSRVLGCHLNGCRPSHSYRAARHHSGWTQAVTNAAECFGIEESHVPFLVVPSMAAR